MARCPYCGSEGGGTRCSQCGAPMPEEKTIPDSQAAKRAALLKGAEDIFQRFKPSVLVCPKCKAQESHVLDPEKTSHPIKCSKCRTEFTVKIVTVRAKNSRKQTFLRVYSVRVKTATGREELIEFMTSELVNLELRAQDLAAFSYVKGKLKMVQNLTIGKYYPL